MEIEKLNSLVAEQIMGWQPVECDRDTELTVYDDGDAWCPRCKAREHINSFEHQIIPPPSYVHDMNAAWQIIQKLAEDNSRWEDKFMEALSTDIDMIGNDWDESGITLKGLAQLTPEKICLTALKAMGIDIPEHS